MNDSVKILMRSSLAQENELVCAAKHFDVISMREQVLRNDLVIGRYSVLPFYKEQEDGLAFSGARLINSFRQHQFVADVMNWYEKFEDITPVTWFRAEDVPLNEKGSFVLKGETNSRKHLWKSHMFAPTRSDIGRVLARLLDDELIGSQRVYVRRFVSLHSYGEAINGLPITNEWRVFILDGRVVAKGYYWSEHIDDLREAGVQPMQPPDAFIDECVRRIADDIRFVVVDVGQLSTGEWIVIELNDGQMSGLSCVDPDELYRNMRLVLNEVT